MKVLEIRLRFYNDIPGKEPQGGLDNNILLGFDQLEQGVLGLRQIGLSVEMKAVELLKAAECLPPGWEPERTGMVAVATDEQLKELINDPDWNELSPETQIEMRSRFQFQKNYIDTRELNMMRTIYQAIDSVLPPPIGPEDSLPERVRRASVENASLKAYARKLRRLWGVQPELPVPDNETSIGKDRNPVTLVLLPPETHPDRDRILLQTSELLGIPVQELFDMSVSGQLTLFRFPDLEQGESHGS